MSDNLFSEDWAIVGVVDPDANSANTYLTAAIDMADYEKLAVIVLCGDQTGTTTTSITASATSGGSYAAISGKSVATGAASPIADSNTQQIINLRSEEIDSNKRYVKVSHVTGGTNDTAVVVLGYARHRPASDGDASSVSSIVS